MQRALRHGPQMRRIATVPARLAAAAAKSGLPPQLLPTRSATTPLPTIACRRLPPPQLLPACCCQRAGAALSKPRQPRGRAHGSVAAMEQVKGQLTLFDLKKVVSSKQTWGMFTQEELQQHHTVLLDPASPKHKLLHVLRKLDCYRLQLADLSSTHIGQSAATLAVHHPREEVRRLASALVDKWRASFDAELFAELPYDAAAAAEAPEGDAAEFQVVAPPPPPPPPAAEPTRVQPPRKERAQRIKVCLHGR